MDNSSTMKEDIESTATTAPTTLTPEQLIEQVRCIKIQLDNYLVYNHSMCSYLVDPESKISEMNHELLEANEENYEPPQDKIIECVQQVEKLHAPSKPSIFGDLLSSWYTIYVYGPPGCGKSSFIRSLANLPLRVRQDESIMSKPNSFDVEDAWCVQKRFKLIEVKHRTVLESLPRPYQVVVLYSTRLTGECVNVCNSLHDKKWPYLLVRNKFDIDTQYGQITQCIQRIQQQYEKADFRQQPPVYVASCDDKCNYDDFSTIRRRVFFP